MSLWRINLVRAAKSVLLILAFTVVPSEQAHADVFSNLTPLNSTGTGSQGWSGAASSYLGNVLYASVNPGYLYKSSDSGTSWSRLDSAGNRPWYAIATNDTGTVVVAITTTGYLYISNDSGLTWNAQTGLGNRTWASVAMNATGTVIAATYGGSSFQLSTDGGSSWSAITPGGSASKGIAISGDGAKIALVSGTAIYTSADTGMTWTPYLNMFLGASTGAYTVSMSRDGQKVLALGGFAANPNYDDKARVTSNFGSSWETTTANIVNQVPAAMTITGDGSRIFAAGSSTYMRYSTNFGSTFTSGSSSQASWISIASDFTGTRAIAVSNTSSPNSGIYISTNSGVTWVKKPISDGISKFSRIEASSDGTKIVAVNSNGQIWISSNSGSTWSVAPNIPSTYYVNCLAMSSDGTRIFMGGANDSIWRSSNGGTSFSSVSGGIIGATEYAYGCAMSADGTKVVLSTATDGVVLSTDGGATFITTILPKLFDGTSWSGYSTVAINSDASKIAVQPANGGMVPVIASTDGGVNWTRYSSSSSPYGMKASADGSVLIQYFYQNVGTPRISRDWGATWTNLPSVLGNSFGEGVSISSDGSLIVMGQNSYTGTLYQSTDYGVSFSAISGVNIGVQRASKLTSSKNMLLVGTDGQQLYKATVQVVQVASFQSISLSTGATAPFRTNVTISAQLALSGSDGKVTFRANGKNIPGCVKVQTSSLIATCAWKPSARGSVTLSTVSYPSDSAFTSGSSAVTVGVANRVGRR